MKLVEKGHFAPRPALAKAAEAVACAVESWPSVHARTHWQLGDETIVDGADFYVGERELGHLHLDSEAHVRMPLTLRNALIEAKLAQPFAWSASFVVHRARSRDEARGAEWIFRLAYDHLAGVSVASLLDRIREHATLGGTQTASLRA